MEGRPRNNLRQFTASSLINRADDQRDDDSNSYKSVKSSDDNESLSSISTSQLSPVALYSAKVNHHILDTYRSGPNVSSAELENFIGTEKKKILGEFEKERHQIISQKQSNYFQASNKKFEDNKFTLTREALEADEKVLMMQYVSFTKELERLASINDIDKRLLKYAYEREFKRAQNRLPFYGYRSDILDSLVTNDVIVVIGETGSGKTTQVVQYLLESGLAGRKKIVCTQPRKFVTVSVAKRVSEELICPKDCTLVTHKSLNNFQDLKNQTTGKYQKNKLIFMTDKSLLSEYRRNKKLNKYSCVVVDEAHERTIFTDILLCELKKLVKLRRADGCPLKLIIMSATIDENKFATYFDNCPIIRVPGRLYPIETFFEKEPRKDYLKATVDKVKNVIKNADRKKNIGDILVFLPSLDDIRKAVRDTKEYLNKNASQLSIHFETFELYGQMDPDEQIKVFKELPGKSKVIFSTNVAETSVTINGVHTVIDSGRVKEKVYDQERNISILKLKLITKSSSTQRKGRSGRCAPGTCYFLYTEEEYDNMEDMTRPEILRMHLGSVVLQLMACGVENVIEYDLLDKPDINTLRISIDKLKNLNLITGDNKITENGRLAAELYLEPSISRMIIEALDYGVGDHGIRIAAMMSVSNNLYSKQVNLKDKRIKQLNTSSCHGDLITLLNIFNEFKRVRNKREWCNRNEYSFSALRLAEQAYFELFTLIRKSKLNFSQKLIRESNFREDRKNQSHEKILNSICAGFHANLAYFNGKSHDGSYVYKLVELNQEAFIHNESVLYVLGENDLDRRFILFGDLIRNEKLYMKNITPIKLDMLADYSQKDYSHIKTSTKEILTENLNSIMSWMFQERNGELIESIEEKLGYSVRIKDNRLETYVAIKDLEISRQIIKSFIELVRSRIKNDVFNYRVDNNVRAILKGGLEVHTLLFPNEYIKLNFMDYDGERESLIKLFEKCGPILDLVDFKSGSSTAKRSGFVVYENCEDAKKAFDELRHEITINPSIATYEQMCLRNSTLKAVWYLTEPTGTAIIELEPNMNIFYAIRDLYQLGYKSKQASDGSNKIIAFNVLKFGSYMDETTFKDHLSRYIAGIKSCSFIRKDAAYINLNTLMDIESVKIKSLFEQCGEIKTIDIMPYGISKAGKLKPQRTVEVKYNSFESVTKAIEMFENKPLPKGIVGYGNMHLSTNFISEFKLPKKALDLYDMECLKALIQKSFNSSIFVDDKLDQYDYARITLKSKEPKSLEDASAFLDNIIKPVTISLPYFQYDKLRKILNKADYQKKLENDHNIHITKDARINQIKIYGKNKSTCEKVRKELEMNLNQSGEENKYVEIKLHSLKVVSKNDGEIFKTLRDEFRGEIFLNFKEKSIRFTSKESQLDSFKNRIEKLNQDYLKENPNIKMANSTHSCGICMDELVNCFTLTLCSHQFCKECLKCQFSNFDASSKLDCVVCGTEISLADLKCLENHEEMQKKCSIALSKFMTNNPRFRYCDGGCNLVMKLTCNQKETWCDNCRKKESSRKADESYNEYLKASKTTKKCPKCSYVIEKNDGCNHMTCYGCKAHFCWICLFDASDSQSIYSHLTSNHGGYFDVPQ